MSLFPEGERGKEGKNFCRFYPDEKRAWRFAFRAFRFWANLEDKEKKNWNSQEREKMEMDDLEKNPISAS